jgi:hypothetical protein
MHALAFVKAICFSRPVRLSGYSRHHVSPARQLSLLLGERAGDSRMSNMACLCGGIIRDNLVPCPTEGLLLRDQDQESYYDDTCRDVVSFFAAVRTGHRDAWIRDYFSPQYPTDVGDDGIVSHIVALCTRQLFLSVAECQECGRLWVQRSRRQQVPQLRSRRTRGLRGCTSVESSNRLRPRRCSRPTTRIRLLRGATSHPACAGW